MTRLVVLVIVLLAVAPACRENPSGLTVGTGTISASGVECSAWFLHADAGRWYELTDLDAEFQQRGLRVRFTLKKRSDMVSACMVGDIADVVSLTKL